MQFRALDTHDRVEYGTCIILRVHALHTSVSVHDAFLIKATNASDVVMSMVSLSSLPSVPKVQILVIC